MMTGASFVDVLVWAAQLNRKSDRCQGWNFSWADAEAVVGTSWDLEAEGNIGAGDEKCSALY